ncbi:MAG: thioredoxin family protein [Candidatus Brocadiaceae bacterium]|nr:thioredoxin family protein [Candidatus Brocadiaceae bacterium]
MRRYALSFLAALATIPIAGTVIADNKGTPPAIVWEKTLEDAIAKAKTTGTPILLDFFVPT